MLKNIYLCGINNNQSACASICHRVVICLKISTFVVSTTTAPSSGSRSPLLWFAWKYLSLWHQQQLSVTLSNWESGCDLLENIYLCGINNNRQFIFTSLLLLWFAWKYLSLWHQQQRGSVGTMCSIGCDLLENIYLCGINNNYWEHQIKCDMVVICLKISIFVASTTTGFVR